MSEKVVVTKSKLDALADAINTKAGQTGQKTIDQMKAAVAEIAGLSEAPVWEEGGVY